MYKLMAFALCVLMAIGCDYPRTVLHAQGINTSSSPVTPDFIDSLFIMKKDELLSFFGDGYENVYAGSSDEEYDGYSYKEYGLTLVFSNYDDLAIIFPHIIFDIYGAKRGMTLAEIQAILGEAEIKDGWYGVPDHYAFVIDYFIGKSRYEFKAVYEMDAPAFLRIYWGRRRISADYIESLFEMTKDEVITRFGEWVWGVDIAMGRKPELVETGINSYEGLYFSEWGFTFAFEDDDTVSFIILDESVEVNRVGSGMTFFQIQTELGETEVMMSKKGEGFEYSVEYIINGNKYRFLSNKPGGSESILVINQLVYVKVDGN